MPITQIMNIVQALAVAREGGRGMLHPIRTSSTNALWLTLDETGWHLWDCDVIMVTLHPSVPDTELWKEIIAFLK